MIALVPGAPRPIQITLTPEQVEEILAAAARPRAALPAAPCAVDPLDPRLSRSLQRGLGLLALMQAEEREYGVVELAAAAGMSASTAHRYVRTLHELGLVERSPDTRRYRCARRAAG
jgi:hypothetical protein